MMKVIFNLNLITDLFLIRISYHKQRELLQVLSQDPAMS